MSEEHGQNSQEYEKFVRNNKPQQDQQAQQKCHMHLSCKMIATII